MNRQKRHLYEFGQFRIDVGERQLLRGEEQIALTPKAFDTLLVLVENCGHALDKKELMEKVWPDSFVEENNLAQNISTLRKALGESEAGLKYIETVPKRGYRFVADVKELWDEDVDLVLHERTRASLVIEEEIDDEEELKPVIDIKPEAAASEIPSGALVETSAQALASTEIAAQTIAPHQSFTTDVSETQDAPSALSEKTVELPAARPKHFRRSVALFACLAFVAAIIAGYFVFKRSRDARRIAAHQRALAILPFRNLKQDAETDFLGFSLADAIITKLGYVSELTVRPSSYIDKYRNLTIDPQKVAADLNVNTLLTGGFIKEGDDLRITAQLIDVGTNEILWRDTLDMKYERLLTVQDRVAQEIIKGLQLKLTPAEANRLNLDVPQNPLAYEYYLRGVDLYSQNQFPMAVEMLEKSVALDSSHALAWAHLGTAYAAAASFRFGGRDYYTKAQAAYQKALSLNPEQIEARIFTANTYTDTNHVEDAVPLLRDALKTNPNYALAHWELGYAYRFAGVLKESVAEGERAREIDPEVKLNSSAFNSYLYDGEYEKFLRSLPAREDSAFILFYRGFGNFYLKNRERAASDFNRAYELDPTLFQAQIGRALSLGLEGQNQKGLTLLRETEQKVLEHGVGDAEGIYKVAQAYAALGDKASALRVLKLSIEGGFFCYPYFTSDPLLENLRGEAQYSTLMEQARKRHEEFKKKFF
ncbi:MAG: winged helix-turn-helix domain-containing protein [Pyrinomonadaceae bacterium]